MKKITRLLLKTVAAFAALYLLLLIPGAEKGATENLKPNGHIPFFWNRDTLWQQTENNFRSARHMPALQLDSIIENYQNSISEKFDQVSASAVSADDARLAAIENEFFNAAAYVAAKPAAMNWYLQYSNLLRSYIKTQSRQWNVKDTAVKNNLYQLLYGIRAATEETMLQTGVYYEAAPAVTVQDEKSAAPFTTLFGVKVHSGDLLVSRGGAEVSALISRSNDYPGNFSHVALIYIDEKDNHPYLIEAHIEKGVALSSVEQYVADKKLRFMVLRLRSDLPAMQQDSLLPHKAAMQMFLAAQRRHIPYDFKMNFYDSSALFCSEVASYAYKAKGIQLWQNVSTLSAPGVINWLHDFGVENFVTQMPSDLEYDPQLSIVAEWRDPATLYKDHMDNAAMDALLEQAGKGKEISYNHWMLPVARVIKAWCWIKNRFGKEGLIPEGMSAARALKNETFVAMHNQVKTALLVQADLFEKQNGYKPPYWQLVKMAEEIAEKVTGK